MQRGLHEVVAEEAAAAGDQQALAGQPAELGCEVGADRIEVLLQEFGEARDAAY